MLSAALALALACHARTPSTEDLAKRYPGGKISFSGEGLTWSCTPADVWELKSFELPFRKEFSITCGKSTVAIGAHETNVLWAVVFPDEPAHLSAKGQPGDGETTSPGYS